MSITRLFEPKTGVNRWLTIIVCFAYIISPIDLMPGKPCSGRSASETTHSR